MSGIVRRLVLRLAEAGVYQPVWTERIGEEWRRNASRIWEIPPEVMAEQWADMNARFPQALEHDAQAYEASLRYSDPKDFHVIAAGLARRARCGLQQVPVVQVMTWNLKDFNRSELRRQGLDVYNPDRMLAQWWQQDAGACAPPWRGYPLTTWPWAANPRRAGRDAAPRAPVPPEIPGRARRCQRRGHTSLNGVDAPRAARRITGASPVI